MNRLLTILLCLITLPSLAQDPYKFDNNRYKEFVGEVDNMGQDEIVYYNKLKGAGVSDTMALCMVNCQRAYGNLRVAPEILLQYHNEVDADGKVEVTVRLINSTPKMIKRATFTFGFINDEVGPAYDIKTGKKYLTISFEHLSGFAQPDSLSDLPKSLLSCYHELGTDVEKSGNTFYNHNVNAEQTYLVKAVIVYEDGKSPQDDAIRFYPLFVDDGPLQPLTYFIHKYITRDSPDNDEEDIPQGDKADVSASTDEGNEADSVYTMAEVMPHFNGDVNEWLAQHTTCPIEAVKMGVKGKVVVSFVVGRDGSIRQATIAKSDNALLDAAALQTIKLMPQWCPGYHNGKPVSVRCTLPVSFGVGDKETVKRFKKWKRYLDLLN